MTFQHKHILALTSLLLLLGSCKKFLDAKADDQFTDEQVFSNPLAIQQALNGIYSGLAGTSLYGGSLTMEAVDIIGLRYNNTAMISKPYEDISNNYALQGAAGSTFDLIWSKAYALVLKTNNFISQLEKARDKGVIPAEQSSLLLGEATGIRALLQFDLLRLYGPVYMGPEDDAKPAIPYYTLADGKVQPILNFGDVMAKVFQDLQSATQLLAKDPIISAGVIINTSNVDFYSGYRNRRMNYYAVQALMARVYLYDHKNELAHSAAKTVVDATGSIFPWTDYAAVVGVASPDRIFSSEVIFGLNNTNLYNQQALYFSASLFDYQMLAPTTDQLEGVFEGNENDYRFTTTWLNSNNGFRTFYKYADLPDMSKTWRFFQPLIRKTELYYILAETDPDPATAVHYLNQVRYNRGLTDLPDDAQLSDYGGEIEKEYQKEFYGEGQMFFYYKRIQPWWLDIYDWQVPLPLSETQLR